MTPAAHSRTLRIQATVLLLLAILDLIRGAIHWLMPDSGAGLIAGMNLMPPGGTNIVFMLAVVGVEQMAWAVLYLLVALRYRALIRLMFALELFKNAAVLLTEYFYKRPTPHVPGRYMHIVILIVMIVMLALPQDRSPAVTHRH